MCISILLDRVSQGISPDIITIWFSLNCFKTNTKRMQNNVTCSDCAVSSYSYKTTPSHNLEDHNINLRCLALWYWPILRRWHAEDKATPAHLTNTQFFVHLRGEIGTTFPNQALHTYLHGSTQNVHYWGSALHGFLHVHRCDVSTNINEGTNTSHYDYSTELDRVDSVKMDSYLRHNITNNLYITCEWW